jgi:anthranilate synthase component 2
MAVQHVRYPLFGVQFHPESFLTQHGFRLVENFLRSGPLKGSLS